MGFGSIVAGVTGAVGLASGIKSSNKANNLSKDQLKLQERQFALTREQYDRWLRIFGPIEENMSEFYNNLTPDYFKNQGLQAYEKEFQDQQQQMTEYFAQADVPTGVEIDQRTKMSMQAVRDKAQIRTDAPFKVADEKNKFLGIGTGVQANAVNATTYAANSYSNVLGSQSNIAAASANQGFAAAASGAKVIADELDRYYTANTGASTISGHSTRNGYTPEGL